jgi:hypothetical protein
MKPPILIRTFALSLSMVACLEFTGVVGDRGDFGDSGAEAVPSEIGPARDGGRDPEVPFDAGQTRDATADAEAPKDPGRDSGAGGGTRSDAGSAADAGADPRPSADGGLARFSFFVTSYKAVQALSGNQAGFGGDLKFGETGPGAGLRGADKICAAVAERSMPGSSAKQWRAFLSATADENGKQVNAIDRIGNGPWYDRLGRLFANNKSELLNDRPTNAAADIKDDFPNENGVPNHDPDSTGNVDNHDILTGSNERGELYSATATCKDWTTSDGSSTNGRPRVGHSWPRDGFSPFGGADAGRNPRAGLGAEPGETINMANWMSALDESGCAAKVNLIQNGGPPPGTDGVGSGGGYGGFYCFALVP